MLGMVAAAAVFLCGTTAARTVPGILLSGLAWPLASLRGLPWFGRSLRIAGTGARTPALIRTVVWSLLGLAVFGTIFASANPVFGSWVDRLVPNLTFNDLVGRAFLACFVFAATLGAAYLALNPAKVDVLGDRRPAPLANRFEWLVPVLVVDAVFLAFIAAQARALFGGRDYIEATTGLTYADYVHQGFGQLTLATALTVLVVWVASRRAGADPGDRRWLFASLGLLCALTLLVVASALRGMSIYQDAYGFTTLRLFVDVFEGWLGFVVLAIMVAGALGLGRWLPRIALVSGAVGAHRARRDQPRRLGGGAQHRPLRRDRRPGPALSPDPLRGRRPGDRRAVAGGRCGMRPAAADLQLPEAGDPRRPPGVEPGSLARRGRDRPDRPPRRCGWRRRRRRMRWRVGRLRRVACVSWTRASDFCAPDLVRRAADVTGSGECPVDPMLIHF